MKLIIPNLYVGNDDDCPDSNRYAHYPEDWLIVHAEKDPDHRRAVGYTGRALDRTHPQYWWLDAPGNLYLNLIDAPEVGFIPGKIMDYALQRLHGQIAQGKSVLVHCNRGESRAPALALLYLNRHTDLVDHRDVLAAMLQFKEIYPAFAPGKGIEGYLRIAWAIEQEEKTRG